MWLIKILKNFLIERFAHDFWKITFSPYEFCNNNFSYYFRCLHKSILIWQIVELVLWNFTAEQDVFEVLEI